MRFASTWHPSVPETFRMPESDVGRVCQEPVGVISHVGLVSGSSVSRCIFRVFSCEQVIRPSSVFPTEECSEKSSPLVGDEKTKMLGSMHVIMVRLFTLVPPPPSTFTRSFVVSATSTTPRLESRLREIQKRCLHRLLWRGSRPTYSSLRKEACLPSRTW